MKHATTLAILLLASVPLRAGDEAAREPFDPDTVEYLRQMRALDFAACRDMIGTLGASGGLFPKVFSNETAVGIVVGICRRFPDRIDELMPPKVGPKDGFRRQYYLALHLGGGPRATAMLRALPEKDEDLLAVLRAIDAADAPRKSLLDLDPYRKEERQVLVGALLMRSDAECALRLLTCLARTPEQITKSGAPEAERRAQLEVREELIRFLGSCAAADASFRALVRNVRLLAAPALHADLDWILAQDAAARDATPGKK
jgi:hypothetical protein